mmetsp:Transcript_21353/g.32549  ORF Transcript_21353/g.32549 Transcript_21353/m.32549 type:complete len:237 (+) Transcript_21353:2241-2951(+)
MQRMVGYLVLGNVIKGILEGPVSDGIALGKSTSDGRVFELIDPRALESLPPGTSVDHAIGTQSLESTLEGLDLAHLIVLFDVLLPKIGSVLSVVSRLVADGDALRAEYLRLEIIRLLDLLQELHGLGEEVEGIDDHHLTLSIRQVSHAVKQVGDDAVTSDHCVGEDGVSVVLDGDFEGEHGLFLQMLEAHFLGFGDKLFLVELLRIEGGGRADEARARDKSRGRGEEGERKQNPHG